MAKLTMHDEIRAVLVAETSPTEMTTQPEITKRLRYDPIGGSRALVLKELYLRDPHIHMRKIERHERRPEHGKARFFWWYDETTQNRHFLNPNEAVPDEEADEQSYLDAIDKVLEGLAGSDFVTHCGARAMEELRMYREDMAKTLMVALA
ncbi:MAG: hypothetical protein CMK82_11195 [Pseudomonadales bacterium]|uniref:hypothetical protein n=1 Tax=Sphingobium sp. TaxID=1912891 RepID=UPI000C51A446|nr:hypothetical protein [Sphingobium sp.]MAS67345.1 hypothetical protein [Pseudomonadales bacterium]MBS90841.1 hypothetical protein [Sphingobium sp.]|tara:strand:+ start:166 stop:615 length:450 start_codon:yes stop_codon:yes gene_type:complete